MSPLLKFIHDLPDGIYLEFSREPKNMMKVTFRDRRLIIKSLITREFMANVDESIILLHLEAQLTRLLEAYDNIKSNETNQGT